MSTFTLKIIALILMVIDHVGYYFEGTPLWFRLLGRSSYPLFLFCMVWGYHYTKSRKTFLVRFYLASIFMTVLSLAIDHCLPTEHGYGNHNIFLSMFIVCVVISLIEIFPKDRKKGWIILGAIVAVQLLYYITPGVIPYAKMVSGDILTGFIPNLFVNEYGFPFIILGVSMYFLKERKKPFCIMYVSFCAIQFCIEMITYGAAVQWLMIAALPLMLRYNNKKGPGMKYFFYTFYPAHTVLLFYLANFVL